MKLVSGSGDEKTGACWMSAINWYMYNGKSNFTWSDHPKCVDPIIRELCIRLNDLCVSDKEREELIGPHIFSPVGTKVNNELTQKRAYYVADKATRKYAAIAFTNAGLKKEAENLKGLREIVDKETAEIAMKAVEEAAEAAFGIAARAAGAAHKATWAAAWAARAAAGAAGAAGEAGAAAGAAARAAGEAAGAAAWAAAEADYKKELLNLILELCSMGNREENPNHTKKETIKFLCSFK